MCEYNESGRYGFVAMMANATSVLISCASPLSMFATAEAGDVGMLSATSTAPGHTETSWPRSGPTWWSMALAGLAVGTGGWVGARLMDPRRGG